MTAEREREIPDPVVQELESARRLVLGARPRLEITCYKRAAVAVWRVVKIARTVDPLTRIARRMRSLTNSQISAPQ